MNQQNVSAQERREHDEPREGVTGVPAGVYVVIAAAVAIGSIYIASEQFTAAPDVGDHRTFSDLMPKEKSGASEGEGYPPSADGAALYAARCAACHQANGTGLPGVFPPLAGSDWVTGQESTLAGILLHGVTGTLTVSGVKYNGTMPAFKTQLSDAEIAALATYLRTQWGNRASPVSAEGVRAARTATASREMPWNGDADLVPLK